MALVDFGGGEDIRFERIGKAGVVTLTRPKALNAVNRRMVHALSAALDAWARDDAVAAVVIKGEGRAFSAGGDLMDIYESGRAGDPPIAFFADEYRLNAAIHRFQKPYVALIDGIVMGGGVGVSFHGSHRILGGKALFAMPEVGIGFFPDVGGSHILPGLRPDGFGMYLALTGARIGPGDALHCGLATHAVQSEDLAPILDAICQTGDPDKAVAALCVVPDRTIDDATMSIIGRTFTLGTLSEVVATLEKFADGGNEFAVRTLETIAAKSPTSLEVAFRQISAGGMLSMDECMMMEFRILNRMLAGADFYEGIRTAIIDKGETPRWKPASLAEIDAGEIERFFAPLAAGDLPLP